MNTNKLILSLLILISTSLLAQNKSGNWCFTDQQTQILEQQNPNIIQQRQDLEDYILSFSQTYDPVAKKATIIIPVVVHNVTHSGGQAYVSKAQIEAQIATLNQDFKRLNPDAGMTRALFAPYATSLDIEFRLARKDPNGNCTEGIVRVESPLSLNPNPRDNVKATSYWDSKKYFNIWVIDEIQNNPDGSYVAGYAQFPSSGINSTYGVVMVNQNFDGGQRTLTHEVGHCFNLYHTFQSSCGGSCGSSGDYCCDTPPVFESSFPCDFNQNTCSNDNTGGSPYGGNVVDQIENYMSYNSCQNMFSLNQKTRMMAVLNSTSTATGLAQLWNAGNLAFTGTADPYDTNPICIPWGADFTYNKTKVCEGEQVTFNDMNTYNATPTLWDWTFVGGSPNVSNAASPVITYNTAGSYGATYSPGTSAGYYTPAVSKNNIITVSSIVAQYTLPFTDSFENTSQFNNDWTIETLSGLDWELTSTAAYTGTKSVIVYNNYNSPNDVTQLISPSYNPSSMTVPKLSWKSAFAKKATGSSNDQLIIYSSIDCGASWQIVTIKTASTMSSAPNTDADFFPSGTAQWKTFTQTLSAGLASSSNVRFKFYLKNNGGNNLFLDDINVFGDSPVGINEFKPINNFSVYPNPTKESAFIAFDLKSEVQNLKITLKDVLGKEITTIVNGHSFISGRYNMSIDQGKKLSSGLYFIEFNADNNITIEKLIVQ